MAIKIFISYAKQDKDFADKIHNDLEKIDHEIWRNHKNLKHAILWNQDITEGIINADCVVLLWSSHAKSSVTVHQEITMARALLKPIIPVKIPDEKEVQRLPKEIEFLQVITHSKYDELFNKLNHRLDEDLSKITYPIEPSNLYIPHDRNLYFVGREIELARLFMDLYGPLGRKTKNIPFVIKGLPGIGKTHLATEFAYRISILFPKGIFWIDAHGKNLTAEYVNLANNLGIRRFKNESDESLAQRILKYLSNFPDSLLIMDNVTERDTIKNWTPKGAQSCAVLIILQRHLVNS